MYNKMTYLSLKVEILKLPFRGFLVFARVNLVLLSSYYTGYKFFILTRIDSNQFFFFFFYPILSFHI